MSDDISTERHRIEAEHARQTAEHERKSVEQTRTIEHQPDADAIPRGRASHDQTVEEEI